MSHAPMPGADVLAEPMRSRWSPVVFDDEQVVTLLHVDRCGHPWPGDA